MKETKEALDGTTKVSDLPGGAGPHSVAHQKGPLNTDDYPDQQVPSQHHKKKKQLIHGKHKHHKSSSTMDS